MYVRSTILNHGRAAADEAVRRSCLRLRGCPQAALLAPGFSMIELMFAVAILGVGLLITSSMFPIAWYKAREVAEGAVGPTTVDTADVAARLLLSVNGPYDNTTSFFPGDWVHGPTAEIWQAGLFPDTRVHALNMGNYAANAASGFVPFEPNPFDPTSSVPVPVADNGWMLEDGANPRFSDPASASPFGDAGIHLPRIAPHMRLFPPMELRPQEDAPNFALWDEQFAGRRYCWSALYRFSQMPGPDGRSDGAIAGCMPPAPCPAADLEATTALSKARQVTMYYFTLKRPGGARYARQVGYDLAGGGWDSDKRPNHPRARVDDYVLLPCPWRIEAELLNVPDEDALPTGVPSDIQVDDFVLAEMLQTGTVLVDDRTGRVCRVTQRRDTDDPNIVVLTLDVEYTAAEIYVADYQPFPNEEEMIENWTNEWNFPACAADPDCSDPGSTFYQLRDFMEVDEPERRFYWLFPPPVESVASDGRPIFDGTPPVVSVEVRQLIIAPRLN